MRPPRTLTASEPAAVSRPKMEARCEPSDILRTPKIPAFLAFSSASFLARCGSGLSLGPLSPYRPSLFLEVFLPILPSSPLWRLPLPPCSSGPFFLSHSGISSSFSSGGLMRKLTKRLSALKRSRESDFGSHGEIPLSPRHRLDGSADCAVDLRGGRPADLQRDPGHGLHLGLVETNHLRGRRPVSDVADDGRRPRK